MKPSFPSWVACKETSYSNLCRLYPKQDAPPSLIFTQTSKRKQNEFWVFFLTFPKFLIIKIARAYYRKFGEKNRKLIKKGKTALKNSTIPHQTGRNIIFILAYFFSVFSPHFKRTRILLCKVRSLGWLCCFSFKLV